MIAKAFIGSNELDTKNYSYNPNNTSQSVVCSKDIANSALLSAFSAKTLAKSNPIWRRIEWLRDISAKITAQKEELARAVTLETGKPLKFSKVEVDRCAQTVALCANQLLSMQGETFASDASQSGINAISYYKREPVGVVVAITPFNFPLNLVVHKIAPALAMGNAVVLKPAPEAPYSAYLLAKIFIDSEFAVKDALSVVYGDAEVGDALVTSDIPRVISFTGSVPVGKIIMRNAGIKKVSLELGGNAGTYIDKSANLQKAACRCALGAFINSGQVCISLQRIYVHEDIYEEFANLFAKEKNAFIVGNPLDENTVIGPLINEEAACRAENWVNEAVKEGAKILFGGKRDGLNFEATALIDVQDNMKIVCEEVFAPVASIVKVKSHMQAFEKINAAPYGLQHGVFTESLQIAKEAIDMLECGGVLINDMPTLRLDISPYGGVKLSGVGREGPKFAMEEFSEIKSVIIC